METMRRLLVATGAMAALTVAGCGTTAAPSLQNAQLSAAEVIQQTAQKADDVNTYAADLVVNVTDAKGVREGSFRAPCSTRRPRRSPPTSTSPRWRSTGRACPAAYG
ncbi:hypothetical protein GCM10027612_20220 [Microbispora bryophytorum subsp. camponoti]